MRLYRYVSTGGGLQPRIAIAVDGAGPVDLIEAWCDAKGTEFDYEIDSWMTSTLALIEEGPAMWSEVAAVVRASSVPALVQSTGGHRFICPLDRLSSLRDFLAFESHVKRAADRRDAPVPPYWYEAPVYYKGNHRSILGPDEVCPWPRYAQQLDFELELAMIIGRKGRDVPTDRAGGSIFGFTVLNDFSARDVQVNEMSAWLGPAKAKDFASALGPCIVTADEIGREPDLAMICRVNGEEWGRARSSEARWSWPDMIAHVSDSEDIWPGDVYGSGTPGGCCGLDLGRELQPGDEVELEIEEIGVLRNRAGARP